MRTVNLAEKGDNSFSFLFNLKKNMRSIIYQTYVFTSLQKDFAFLLTDPKSQDFLDPEKSFKCTGTFSLKQM